MKIVVINGQNHKGSTYHMGNILANLLVDEDNITEFFLPRDLNHFCVGCYQCIEDVAKCPYYTDKKVILDAMEQADLFIFTSPNYCLGPSAPMKSLLDLFFDNWMVHRPQEWMFHKKAVILSTSAGALNNKPIKMVKDSLTNWGIPYVRTYGRSVQAMNWEMVKEEKKARIQKDMEKLAKKIRRAKNPKPGIIIRFTFMMMGKMHSAGWDSSPVEQEYWRERGWLDHKRPWKN